MAGLNFKTYGQGDPIIILHGLFGMLDNWQKIAKGLADEYMVILVDQRNHGKSPHHDTHTYQEMAADLAQFMEEQWIYEATIIGHSMGGKTAMQLAMDYPDLVEKLIVIDMSPRQSKKGGHDEIFDAMFSLDLDQLDKRSEAEEKLAGKIKDLGVRQFLLKNLQRKKEGGYRWKMNLEVLYQQYDDILVEISTETPFEKPTLFVKGGKSEYIREKDELLIKTHFPSYKIIEIEDAGHWVHADAPKETIEIIKGFVQNA